MSEQQAALTHTEFADLLAYCCPEFDALERVAVAVSGGPDSMALAALLHNSVTANNAGPELHLITVDHGLRVEAAQEARHVENGVSKWQHTRHVTQRWTGAKPETGVQEAARRARYRLISEYCHNQNIAHVFMAHHADDQAETVLFRLARGSGLDGLAGMPAQQRLDSGITVLRPFLSVEKSRLVATCQADGLEYIRDPSNADSAFARSRLRQAYDVLAAEGLTGQRLQRTAKRLNRGRYALAQYTEEALASYVTQSATKWTIARRDFCALPEEIALRVMQAAFVEFGNPGEYFPRMEKQEVLLKRLREEDNFKAATLGGCYFVLDKRDMLEICAEA